MNVVDRGLCRNLLYTSFFDEATSFMKVLKEGSEIDQFKRHLSVHIRFWDKLFLASAALDGNRDVQLYLAVMEGEETFLHSIEKIKWPCKMETLENKMMRSTAMDEKPTEI